MRLLPEIRIELHDTCLTLLPSKMVWWADQHALILADTHFGKASTFRKAGLPIPAGTSTSMLRAISFEVDRLCARQLIVVGDFIHSSVTAGTDYEDELRSWRTANRHVGVFLVRGNHDTRRSEFYENLSIEVSDELSADFGSLRFCHFPELATSERFTICGHMHPAVRVGRGPVRESFACFLLSNMRLVLPAFGEFTGRAIVRLNAGDFAYGIAADGLFSLQSEHQ